MYSPQNGDKITVSKVSNPPLEVYGSSKCHKTANNDVVEAKIMVINNATNAVELSKVRFTLTSGHWYGIAKFYRNGAKYSTLCVDNEINNPNECAPYKQINYFDLSQEGKWLDGATWEDATNIYPQIITCNPTPNPTSLTIYPTHSPTTIPTSPPTSTASLHPTQVSTRQPSYVPTHPPTIRPSSNPSAFPSMDPSDMPSQSPSNIETITSDVYPSEDQETFIYDIFHINVNSTGFHLFIGATIGICLCFCIALLCVSKKRKESPSLVIETVGVGDRASRAEKLVQKWLNLKVELPEYLDNFLLNGYRDINDVIKIKDEEGLEVIGITKAGHQKLLLCEIQKLRTIARRKKKKKKKQRKDRTVQGDAQHPKVESNVNVSVIDDSADDTSDADDTIQNIEDFIYDKGETKAGEHDVELQDDEFIVEDDDDLTPINDNEQENDIIYVDNNMMYTIEGPDANDNDVMKLNMKGHQDESDENINIQIKENLDEAKIENQKKTLI